MALDTCNKGAKTDAMCFGNEFRDSSPTLTCRNKGDVVSTSLCTRNFRITAVLACSITSLELTKRLIALKLLCVLWKRKTTFPRISNPTSLISRGKKII